MLKGSSGYACAKRVTRFQRSVDTGRQERTLLHREEVKTFTLKQWHSSNRHRQGKRLLRSFFPSGLTPSECCYVVCNRSPLSFRGDSRLWLCEKVGPETMAKLHKRC